MTERTPEPRPPVSGPGGGVPAGAALAGGLIGVGAAPAASILASRVLPAAAWTPGAEVDGTLCMTPLTALLAAACGIGLAESGVAARGGASPRWAAFGGAAVAGAVWSAVAALLWVAWGATR